MTVYITADRKRVVPAGHKDAAYGVAEADIDRLGLRAAYDDFMAPPVEQKQAEPAENKMAPAPANKARRPRRRKGSA